MIEKLSGPMLPPRSGKPPKQLVVLLHGYGADGNDLIGLGQYWASTLPDALFVSPNAPRPCRENPAGFEWFPLDVDRIAGRIAGVKDARPVLVNFLIDLWTQTGLTAKDTFLVGFSQGAMMSLHVGLSLDTTLAGIVAFSGALVPPDNFGADGTVRPPVALIHGDLDQVVDPKYSQDASVTLQANGFEVAYHRSATTPHGISEDGLEFATAFILSQIATAGDMQSPA